MSAMTHKQEYLLLFVVFLLLLKTLLHVRNGNRKRRAQKCTIQ